MHGNRQFVCLRVVHDVPYFMILLGTFENSLQLKSIFEPNPFLSLFVSIRKFRMQQIKVELKWFGKKWRMNYKERTISRNVETINLLV